MVFCCPIDRKSNASQVHRKCIANASHQIYIKINVLHRKTWLFGVQKWSNCIANASQIHRSIFDIFLFFCARAQKDPFWVQIGHIKDQNMNPNMDHHMDPSLDRNMGPILVPNLDPIWDPNLGPSKAQIWAQVGPKYGPKYGAKYGPGHGPGPKCGPE